MGSPRKWHILDIDWSHKNSKSLELLGSLWYTVKNAKQTETWSHVIRPLGWIWTSMAAFHSLCYLTPLQGCTPLETICHWVKNFYHPAQIRSGWPQSTIADRKELKKNAQRGEAVMPIIKQRWTICVKPERELWISMLCITMQLSLLCSPLLSLWTGEERSAAPLCIRSVERTTRDFTQLLRRNEMICPGAAAKCWMDTFSWDGYRSQL